MPSIGNIEVRRIIQHKLLPPIYEQIVKGPVAALEQSLARLHLILPSLLGAGGESPKPHREVVKFITQSVTVSAGTVNRLKVSGVVGISYTQTSFTFESYTIAGVDVTKTQSDTLTITEPLSVQRVKVRRVFEDSPQLAELSATLTIERTKARSLAQTDIISEALTVLPQTNLLQRLTETDNISESLTTLKESKRLQTETVSESGDVSRELPGVKRTLSETVDVSDSIVKEITYAIGHIANELIENIATSDAVTTTITKTRSITEIIPLASNVTKLVTTGITSFTDTSYTSISYTIFHEVRTEKILTQTVDESHTLRIERTKNRSASDTTSIIDSVTGVWISPNDIIVTDEVIMRVGRGRGLTENVNVVG